MAVSFWIHDRSSCPENWNEAKERMCRKEEGYEEMLTRIGFPDGANRAARIPAKSSGMAWAYSRHCAYNRYTLQWFCHISGVELEGGSLAFDRPSSAFLPHLRPCFR